MMIPQTEVVVTTAEGEVFRKTLAPGDYVLGCGEDADLRIDVDLVSRRHAQLTLNYSDATIEDLGSSNGTMVNGKVVTEPTRLWPNQRIQIGAASVELRRLKSAEDPDVSLAPATATVRRALPAELLHEKKYEIGGVVAQGGMGAILDATEVTIERTVAMKVMLDANSPDDLLRFIAEAKITGQLEHPSIVPVYELSVDELDQVFYTMKFVRGITLRKVLELMAEGHVETIEKYGLPQLLTVFQKVCDAIAFAHSKGVIHRDLKPDNIMLGDYGEVLVMDWGLAKVLGKAEGGRMKDEEISGFAEGKRHTAGGSTYSSLTMAGSIMGTPQYMSPEQANGEVEALDPRTDIYALGAILYHVLTLRPPVEGTDLEEILGKVRTGAIIAPAQAWKRPAGGMSHLPSGRIPDSLAAVAMKALALDRSRRYQTTEELQGDVLAYQNGFATRAENAGLVKQLTLLVKRHKAFAASVVLVLVLSAGFLVKVMASERRATTNEQRALDVLRRLRGTAPTFFGQATALVEKQQFAEALEKITFAVELNPEEATYHAVKGNILQSLVRMKEASHEYEEALKLRPGQRFARENLDLCEAILRQDGETPELSQDSWYQLNVAMRAQGRPAEAVAVLRVLSKDRKVLYETWKAVLKSRLLASLKDNVVENLLVLGDDGLFELNLGGRKVEDLSPLRGMPVRELVINNTKVIDLSPMVGSPLKVLRMAKTPIINLAPLKGLQLTELGLSGTEVTDLSPLAGMPLRVLDLHDCENLADLSPLKGMPLEELDIRKTQVGNLAPLQGMPLRKLSTWGPEVTDLSALQGMPLKFLWVAHSKVRDIRPLAGMPLEAFDATDSYSIVDLRPLQGLPLKFLALGSTGGIRPEIIDLAPLEGLKLTSLNLKGRRVANLSALHGQPILRLTVHGPATTDFSVLPSLPVTELWLRKAGLTDLAVLRGMRVKQLDLGENPITDLSPLAGMPVEELNLFGTKVTDFRPLRELPNLKTLLISPSATDIEVLRQLPALKFLDTQQWPIGAPIAPRTTDQFWKAYDAQKGDRPGSNQKH